jgi:hypothetical protein
MLDFTNYTTHHEHGNPHLEQCTSGFISDKIFSESIFSGTNKYEISHVFGPLIQNRILILYYIQILPLGGFTIYVHNLR